MLENDLEESIMGSAMMFNLEEELLEVESLKIKCCCYWLSLLEFFEARTLAEVLSSFPKILKLMILISAV